MFLELTTTGFRKTVKRLLGPSRQLALVTVAPRTRRNDLSPSRRQKGALAWKSHAIIYTNRGLFSQVEVMNEGSTLGLLARHFNYLRS